MNLFIEGSILAFVVMYKLMRKAWALLTINASMHLYLYFICRQIFLNRYTLMARRPQMEHPLANLPLRVLESHLVEC